MAIGAEELRNRFGYHPATEVTVKTHAQSRERMLDLAFWIDETLPDGRAKACALTALQEAAMWTNFGIAECAPLADDPERLRT